MLGKTAETVSVEGKDKGHVHSAANLSHCVDDFVCASLKVNFLKVGRQNHHFDLAAFQVLHHLMKTNYVAFFYGFVAAQKFSFGRLCFAVVEKLFEFENQCDDELLELIALVSVIEVQVHILANLRSLLLFFHGTFLVVKSARFTRGEARNVDSDPFLYSLLLVLDFFREFLGRLPAHL